MPVSETYWISAVTSTPVPSYGLRWRRFLSVELGGIKARNSLDISANLWILDFAKVFVP